MADKDPPFTALRSQEKQLLSKIQAHPLVIPERTGNYRHDQAVVLGLLHDVNELCTIRNISKRYLRDLNFEYQHPFCLLERRLEMARAPEEPHVKPALGDHYAKYMGGKAAYCATLEEALNVLDEKRTIVSKEQEEFTEAIKPIDEWMEKLQTQYSRLYDEWAEAIHRGEEAGVLTADDVIVVSEPDRVTDAFRYFRRQYQGDINHRKAFRSKVPLLRLIRAVLIHTQETEEEPLDYETRLVWTLLSLEEKGKVQTELMRKKLSPALN